MVLTPTGAEFQFIATDGTELDSGSIPCVVPGAVTLSESQSKTEDRVEADLTHFTPNSAITLTWEDGKLLGNGRTDGEGNARITFRTPSAAQGTYNVTAKDESGLAGTNRLSVIPRIKVTKESVQAGSRIRVYLYGYSANGTVQIRLSTTDSELYVFLGSVEVDANGRASVVVTIPESMQPGDYTLIGLTETAADGSASESIEITAHPTAPEATPV
jgi:5-hydroxyisourate hydrolase-like protein (transthyretin family)